MKLLLASPASFSLHRKAKPVKAGTVGSEQSHHSSCYSYIFVSLCIADVWFLQLWKWRSVLPCVPNNNNNTRFVYGPLSGSTLVSHYRKGKTNLGLLEQEIVSSSGISWAICISAPRPRQITMPAPHHSIFRGQIPFLPSNQQRQSNEGRTLVFLYF